MLVEETLRTCAQYLTAACREESKEQRDQIYHSLVLRGNLQTVVWWITYIETGGVIHLAELCTKTSKMLILVLRTKHPKACPPTADSLDTYPDRPPELVPMDITDDTVMEVDGRLSRGAGLGGADSVSLQYWLLFFVAASG